MSPTATRPAAGLDERAAGTATAVLGRARALRGLDLAVVRRLEGFLRGEHLGVRTGPGSEPADSRPYRPGEDDVRWMDWPLTARAGEPHVREVVADRELETWVLVDLTPSMAFGTTTTDKRRLAVTAAAVVGHLTTRLGDRFGAWVLDERGVLRRPSRTGRTALHAALRELAGSALADPPPVPGPPPRGRGRRAAEPASSPAAPDLAGALERLGAAHRRRGLRVVVSDFLDGGGDDPAAPLPWERALRRLSARHQVVAVEVVDRRERELPDVGVVELVDPESGEVVEVDTGRAAVREAFAAAGAAHGARVGAALRRCGAAHLVLATDEDWVASTARFVLAQRRTARAVDRMAGRA
ncbi:DUF58 domain-containing protein [Pseudokineococcus lusitanus]|uniref:Uncharacterized protein DUF58 n=1 Tax=Pseudokineococcus lusitanus TaxID=763993 RepID=A0A3N1HJZ2_9ACTN|nr:DUF58 domain-containing protein [Pseudokineococcus lusitanus]ROP42857.1 uncharacterized protein DUF58 [Pseudokineococcus lusitanus]